MKNGSTLEMPFPGGDAIRELKAAVEHGKISEADVDARLDELLELVLTTHAARRKGAQDLSTPRRITRWPAARQRRAWSCSKTRAVCFL